MRLTKIVHSTYGTFRLPEFQARSNFGSRTIRLTTHLTSNGPVIDVNNDPAQNMIVMTHRGKYHFHVEDQMLYFMQQLEEMIADASEITLYRGSVATSGTESNNISPTHPVPAEESSIAAYVVNYRGERMSDDAASGKLSVNDTTANGRYTLSASFTFNVLPSSTWQNTFAAPDPPI